jgi:hypothetical protein
MEKYSINIGAGIHNEENRSGQNRQNMLIGMKAYIWFASAFHDHIPWYPKPMHLTIHHR